MNDRNFSDRSSTRRPDRSDRFRGDDLYYGGPRSQREDWDHRAFDGNDFDRQEGMYEAGGRDFDETFRDYRRPPEGGDRNRGWWARHSPLSGGQPWYEARSRHEGFAEKVRNFFGVGPKGYRRTDERIREDVCEALARHPGVDASDIEVRVKDAHVILTGTVENRWMRRQAEDAVDYVPGVEDVRVELTVPRSTESAGELRERESKRRLKGA